MARKHDTMFRDSRLNLIHGGFDIPFPAAGMPLPFVEYDRGRPVGVISYQRRGTTLPTGRTVARTYSAFERLYTHASPQLPFMTAIYDSRNWAFKLFAHNDAAYDLIGIPDWLHCTEEHFVRLLYRMRGRKMPKLSSYRIDLSSAPWIEAEGVMALEDWPGQAMSRRRRTYEPEGIGVTFNMLNPCADIDLAVVGEASGLVTLLVDYKLEGAHIDPRHKTHQAMSNILTGGAGHSLGIPSMIVRYDPTGDEWAYHVWCLNEASERLLAGIMSFTGAVVPGWRPDGWTYVNEARWYDLLMEAQRS